MRRWYLPLAVLLVAFIAGFAIAATVANAQTKSPTPTAACTWQTNGQIIDGRMCTCERVYHADGSSSIACEWEEMAELRRPVNRITKKHAAAKKPAARYGISTGVLSHA